MKIINKIGETKPTRIISTCTNGEAFRLGKCWYTALSIGDFGIRHKNKEFVEEHALYGHEKTSVIALLPCVHLSSMTFVYIDGNREADEWAEVTATLTTP